MAEHVLKAKRVQTDQIGTRNASFVGIEDLLRYLSAATLVEDLDIPYKKWVEDLLAETLENLGFDAGPGLSFDLDGKIQLGEVQQFGGFDYRMINWTEEYATLGNLSGTSIDFGNHTTPGFKGAFGNIDVGSFFMFADRIGFGLNGFGSVFANETSVYASQGLVTVDLLALADVGDRLTEIEDILSYAEPNLFQLGFADDFFQFFSGEYTWVIDSATVAQMDNSRLLMNFGSDAAFYLGADSINMSLDGQAANLTIDPDVIEVNNAQGGFRIDSSGFLWSLGTDQLTADIIAGFFQFATNTDGIVFGDPVYKGGNTAADELLKRSEVEVLVAAGGGGLLNTDQFVTEAGVNSIKSVFVPGTASTFDFSKSRDIGTLESPIVGDITVTRSGEYNNVVKVILQSVEIPTQLGASKPSWMVLTGETYDPFAINELTFTYKKVHKDGSTSIQNAVVCEIVTHPSLNAVLDPWYMGLLVNGMFNDNRALSSPDTLVNNVPWGTAESEIRVEGGASAAFTALPSGNFALRTGQTTSVRSLIIFGANALAKLDNAAITLITRFRGGGATGTRVIASNIDSANLRGFILTHNFSDNRIRLEIGDQAAGNRVSWADLGIVPSSETWIEVAITWKAGIARIWGRVPSVHEFGVKATKTDYPVDRNINSGLPIRLDHSTSGANPANWKETDYCIVYVSDTVLPGKVILEVKNNPNNAAKIIQDWEHPTAPIIFLNDPQPQAGGFAGLYNGGLGVSGGREGRILEYDNYERLLEDYRNSDPDEREEYRYTGNDFTTSGLLSVAKARVNKTVVGLGQRIEGVDHRHESCRNIIWQNLEIVPPPSNWPTFSRDAISFQGCEGIWLHRMTFDGKSIYAADDPTAFADCLIDIGWFNLTGERSDLVTLSDCVLKDAEKGITNGYDPADTFTATGKLRVTIMNTLFQNIRQRPPFSRGLVHLANCLYDYDVTIPNNPINLGIATVDGGRIYAENNYYERGHRVYRNEGAPSDTAGILDIGSFRNNAGYVVAEASDQPYNSHLVTWTPAGQAGYTYPKALASPADARTWILANAGATLNPIV